MVKNITIRLTQEQASLLVSMLKDNVDVMMESRSEFDSDDIYYPTLKNALDLLVDIEYQAIITGWLRE